METKRKKYPTGIHFFSEIIGYVDKTAMIYVVFMLVGLLAACSGGDEPKTVAVTVPAQRWVAQQLLGENTPVVCLLGTGGDPETYEPTMEQMRQLADASLLFTTGDSLGFERAVVERAKANNPSLRVVNTGAGIAATEHHHEHGSSCDPHVWTSVRNVKAMAEVMAAELDVDGTAVAADLDSLDRRLSELLRPVRGTAFVVWHPTFSYFARDYDLRQIAVDDGHELSGAHLREVLDDISGSGARVMVLQRCVDSAQAQAIARELGLTTVEVDIMSDNWENELIKLATVLSHENIRK